MDERDAVKQSLNELRAANSTAARSNAAWSRGPDEFLAHLEDVAEASRSRLRKAAGRQAKTNIATETTHDDGSDTRTAQPDTDDAAG